MYIMDWFKPIFPLFLISLIRNFPSTQVDFTHPPSNVISQVTPMYATKYLSSAVVKYRRKMILQDIPGN